MVRQRIRCATLAVVIGFIVAFHSCIVSVDLAHVMTGDIALFVLGLNPAPVRALPRSQHSRVLHRLGFRRGVMTRKNQRAWAEANNQPVKEVQSLGPRSDGGENLRRTRDRLRLQRREFGELDQNDPRRPPLQATIQQGEQYLRAQHDPVASAHRLGLPDVVLDGSGILARQRALSQSLQVALTSAT